MERSSIRVRIRGENIHGNDLSFDDSFQIGRGVGCEVQLDSELVSRQHVEVVPRDGQWWVEDLDSTNGTYMDGEQVRRVPLNDEVTLELGRNGPVIRLVVEGAYSASSTRPEMRKPENSSSQTGKRSAPDPSLTRYIQHYFETGGSEDSAGSHTRLIRQAYAAVRQKEQQRYRWMIGAVVGLLVLVGGYAVTQYFENRQMRQSAADVFYRIKEIDLAVARHRQAIEEISDTDLSVALEELSESRQKLAKEYEGYIEEFGLRRGLTAEEKLIYKVAQIFNESQFEIPPGFVRTVKTEIDSYWTDEARSRYVQAVRRAQENGYTKYVVSTMQTYGLPPELFYLALQESDFNPQAVGPTTNWGIAKGMWQFLPSTARAYGLQVGPRREERVFDQQDERFHFEKSTRAAAVYLLDLYSTFAQASGLLVIAAYNWGEGRVASKLEGKLSDIPKNPRARSYWQFYKEYQHRMPAETKQYVIRIFAAAVIGQDPRRFGFNFDNPLHEHLEAPSLTTRVRSLED